MSALFVFSFAGVKSVAGVDGGFARKKSKHVPRNRVLWPTTDLKRNHPKKKSTDCNVICFLGTRFTSSTLLFFVDVRCWAADPVPFSSQRLRTRKLLSPARAKATPAAPLLSASCGRLPALPRFSRKTDALTRYKTLRGPSRACFLSSCLAARKRPSPGPKPAFGKAGLLLTRKIHLGVDSKK